MEYRLGLVSRLLVTFIISQTKCANDVFHRMFHADISVAFSADLAHFAGFVIFRLLGPRAFCFRDTNTTTASANMGCLNSGAFVTAWNRFSENGRDGESNARCQT